VSSIWKNGAIGDHAGSCEENGVGPHCHNIANSMGVRAEDPNGPYEFTSNPGFPPKHLTDQKKDVDECRIKKEVTVKNASVLFSIYVGKETTD
jgi:hypothetical protein